MKNKLFNIYHSEVFQGEGRQAPYFEGWYIKMVTQQRDRAIAIIPGVSKQTDVVNHAFIQVMDGTKGKAEYHSLPIQKFGAEQETFNITIDNNTFSRTSISMDLPNCRGDVHFSNHTPLESSTLRPGIMGWYAFVPFMQCYHGIVSMHHQLEGSLTIHGEKIDFTGGTGYSEKDWGSSFPKKWIWLHCNTFDSEQKVSFFASIAHIPWLFSHFIGFLCVFQLGNKQIRFATYTGAKYEYEILNNEQLKASFYDKRKKVEVLFTKGIATDLVTPIDGAMKGKVNESLQAIVQLKYFEDAKLVFETRGDNAGMEIAGDFNLTP